MDEFDRIKLARLIEQLDELVAREGAMVKLESTAESSFITANRSGFLRFGIEMLKAGYVSPEEEDLTAPVDANVDLSYLFEQDEDETHRRAGRVPFLPPPVESQPAQAADNSGSAAIFIVVMLIAVLGVAVAYFMGLFAR